MASSFKRALVLALVLCAGVGAAFEAKKSKTRVSANGTYGIRLLELKEDSCRVEVVREQEVAWTLEKCVGTADDLYFVSDDGSKFWVVYPLPELPPESPKDRRSTKKKRPAVLDAVVATEYDKKGNPLQMKRLGEFADEKTVEDEIRTLGKHFKWLGGVLSVPGKPPRLTDNGEVEFETLPRRTYKLQF